MLTVFQSSNILLFASVYCLWRENIRQYMANREVVTNRPTDYSCIAYTAMFVEVYLFILSDLHLLVFLNHRVAIVFHSHLLNYVYVRLLGVLNKYQSIYQSSPFTKDKDPI